ncbi:MAG TPA: hypothetical protein VKZ50_00430 [bacterium]|nr:hypothetical protein [bacterium]
MKRLLVLGLMFAWWVVSPVPPNTATLNDTGSIYLGPFTTKHNCDLMMVQWNQGGFKGTCKTLARVPNH